MNFRNILWTYASRRDGTCDIKLYFNHLGKKKYFSTDIKIDPKFWSEEKGEVKKAHPMANRYNGMLRRLQIDIETHFLEGGSWLDLFKDKNAEKHKIIEFLSSIIQDGKNGKLSLAAGTLRNYQSTLTRLIQFKEQKGIETTLSKMDMPFYNEFMSFLSSNCGCNAPGLNKHVKILKRVMNIGLEKGVHTNNIHQQIGFKQQRQVKNEKIYLTESEIVILEKAKFGDKTFLQRELDRWLVAYHFLLRFSDVIKISKENVHKIDGDLFFKYVSIKRSNPVTLPIKKRTLNLLEKYNYDFSWGSNPQANRQIKAAVAFAGINETVEIKGVSAPKSSLVTMHTARRSGATNLYLTGQFSLKTIGDLGGWENMKTLQIYLRCSSMDSAKLAAQSDYFR